MDKLFGDLTERDVFIALVDVNGEQYADDDIIDEDGMHHCSKCKTLKEKYIDYGGEIGVVRHAVKCQCERDRLKREKQAQEKKKQEEWKQDTRKRGLRYAEWINSKMEDDDGANPGAKEIIARYLDNWPEMKRNNIGIMLTGTVGTGKSFYGAAIANAVIDQLSQAYMISASEIMERASGFEADAELNRILEYWDLVVLDDLGAERGTSFATEKIYNFIDRRYKSKKPLIVTTNLSERDIQNESRQEYQRIFDRVKEMCNINIPLTGKSRRKEIGDKRAQLAKEILRGGK